jgi:hypothetical protein
MTDRRKMFKKNLKEELDINIDDRASEEHSSNSFIRGQESHPTQTSSQTTTLSKEVYKS